MQTWKTNELPDMWKSTQSSIQKYMPDWKYVLMTDDMNRDFIQKHFPDFLSYYDAFPYNIQRADAIRYCWLYINGGLYLDCDFELQASIDELFIEDSDLFLLASSNNPNVITNGFMASRPKNKLWLDMIEEMKKPPGIYNIERHILVMYTTGPMAFNKVVKKSGLSYVLLPSSKINPCTICDKVCNKPDVLVKPLEGSSWVGAAATSYQWCYCNSQYLITTFIIVVIIVILLMFVYIAS